VRCEKEGMGWGERGRESRSKKHLLEGGECSFVGVCLEAGGVKAGYSSISRH
jgi:hypothetical protein